MEYRCIAASVEGFVRQLAVAYITHGYWFYVAGTIPEGKDPAAVDAKLIERYGIAISKWTRCRRKKQGLANMQYLRHERFFVLLSTKGQHEFFERERASIRDVRRKSLTIGGYSIGCHKGRDGRWHASVRIEQELFVELKSTLLEGSRHCRRRSAEAALAGIRHQPYAPVRRQLYDLWRAVNEARRTARRGAIHRSALPWTRRVVQPFE